MVVAYNCSFAAAWFIDSFDPRISHGSIHIYSILIVDAVQKLDGGCRGGHRTVVSALAEQIFQKTLFLQTVENMRATNPIRIHVVQLGGIQKGILNTSLDHRRGNPIQ